MRRRIYLTTNSHGYVKVDTTLRDVKEVCSFLNALGMNARTIALPRRFFDSLEKEEVIKIFEKHFFEVELIHPIINKVF